MIGYGAHELAESFRTVRRNTIQIADEIPEDQYDFVAAPGARSIRDLLRHIATAPMLQEEMHREKRVATLQGYDFPATHRRVDAEGKKAHSKADLLRMLRSEGERIAAWLASVDDGFLAETFTDVTGQAPRTRFEGLLAMKEHEMHHRGQLMLMQRMLGIVPHLTRQREERARQRAAAATAAGVR